MARNKKVDLDEDIKRVIAYIHAHGFKLRYSRAKKKQLHAAEVDFSDMIVTIWLSKSDSKKEKLMHLLHEAGHIYDWSIELGRVAPNKMGKFLQSGRTHTYSDRYDLYLFESCGILGMERVRRILGLSVPRKDVAKQQRLDEKPYEIYWKTGEFPK